VVCVVELNPVSIDQPDGYVRTESRNRELFKEIPSDLPVYGIPPVSLLLILHWFTSSALASASGRFSTFRYPFGII
jgi:hypothetical protein